MTSMTLVWSRFVVISGLAIALLSGCSANKPPLDEETYISILAELELVYTLHRVTNDSVRTIAQIQDVFRHYGTTDSIFIKAHNLYERDIRGQTRRYDQVAVRLTEENYRITELEVELRNRIAENVDDSSEVAEIDISNDEPDETATREQRGLNTTTDTLTTDVDSGQM